MVNVFHSKFNSSDSQSGLKPKFYLISSHTHPPLRADLNNSPHSTPASAVSLLFLEYTRKALAQGNLHQRLLCHNNFLIDITTFKTLLKYQCLKDTCLNDPIPDQNYFFFYFYYTSNSFNPDLLFIC